MKTYILLAAVCLVSVAGCATKADLNDVRRDFRYLNDKISAPSEDVRFLKEESSGIRSDLKKNEESLSAVRARQAEIAADITSLTANIQRLTGEIETFRKEFDAVQTRSNQRDEEIKNLKEQLDAANGRIDEMIKKDEAADEAKRAAKQVSKENTKVELDKKAAYDAAFNEFKAGRYEKAREEFQDFLKRYPRTEYSDNAQFRIGECYYFEKNYEKAILEYEKVVKNYPDGDRVLSALLRQGLSFQNLGDKSSARIILQQVIRDYPDTNQAKIAREKLREIN